MRNILQYISIPQCKLTCERENLLIFIGEYRYIPSKFLNTEQLHMHLSATYCAFSIFFPCLIQNSINSNSKQFQVLNTFTKKKCMWEKKKPADAWSCGITNIKVLARKQSKDKLQSHDNIHFFFFKRKITHTKISRPFHRTGKLNLHQRYHQCTATSRELQRTQYESSPVGSYYPTVLTYLCNYKILKIIP